MSTPATALRVLREEGVGGFATKAARFVRVRGSRLLSDYDRPNRRRWKELRGRYAGRRAFLIGNGPSLNRTPLHLLESEEVLCFNRFNLFFERLAWRPSMYMNVDPLVATDMAGEIDQIAGMVEHAFLPDYHYDAGAYFRGQLGERENVLWMYYGGAGFHRDLPNYWAGGTVAFAGLQVLAFLGFDPIYLVGVDMSYRIHTTAAHDGAGGIVSTRDDDPNHFDPRYFGKGRNYHQPDEVVLARIDAAFARARRFSDEHGVRILNAGIGGQLEHFPRVDLRTVLDVSPEEELARIDRAVRGVTGALSWSDCLAQAREVGTPEQWNAEDPLATANEAVAMAVIQDALFTHVPIGPFDGRYLFIRRAPPSHRPDGEVIAR